MDFSLSSVASFGFRSTNSKGENLSYWCLSIFALESLAKTLDTRISQQINKMVDQVGLDGDETLTTEMTEVTNTATELAQVAGWKYAETAVQQKGTNKYAVYVLLKYRYSEANKILLQQLKTKEASEIKLRTSKAFQELEEEVNNSS